VFTVRGRSFYFGSCDTDWKIVVYLCSSLNSASLFQFCSYFTLNTIFCDLRWTDAQKSVFHAGGGGGCSVTFYSTSMKAEQN
jgi:hypothetical protein